MIWRGDHYEVRVGDALALLREREDASVDALITDEPYSSGGMMRGDRVHLSAREKYVQNDSRRGAEIEEFTGDNRDQRAFAYWCALWLSECRRVVKPGGPVVLFADWRQLPTITDVFQAGGFVWRGVAPWIKPTARPQRGRFAAASEFVVWGSNGPMPSSGPCLPGYFMYDSPRGKKRVHIAQKPLPLMRDIVKICPVGGIILDPFLGSGTTGEAAVLEGRRIIGFELVEAIAAGAVRRIALAAGDSEPVAVGHAFTRLRIQKSRLHAPNGS